MCRGEGTGRVHRAVAATYVCSIVRVLGELATLTSVAILLLF